MTQGTIWGFIPKWVSAPHRVSEIGRGYLLGGPYSKGIRLFWDLYLGSPVCSRPVESGGFLFSSP